MVLLQARPILFLGGALFAFIIASSRVVALSTWSSSSLSEVVSSVDVSVSVSESESESLVVSVSTVLLVLSSVGSLSLSSVLVLSCSE